MFGLFNTKPAEEETFDDGGTETAITYSGTVRTTKLTNRFVRLSDSDLKKKEEALKKRVEQQKRFEKYLEIQKQWEQQDVSATVALSKHLATVLQFQQQKRLSRQAIEIVREQGRLADARASMAMRDTRSKIDAEIAKLQGDRKQIAKERGWGK